MRKITSDELKSIATEMLKYIDQICTANGIKYYMMFGTLIGAIRHHGFIPWDDDIDICMFRDDYNRFIKLVENDRKYKYIGMETDPNYYFTYGRLTDRRTILKRRPKRKIKDFGIFIDIFPIDNAPNPEKMQSWREEFKEKKIKIWSSIPTRFDDFYWGNITHYIVRAIREKKKRLRYGVKNFNSYCTDITSMITRENGHHTPLVMIAETNGPCVFKREWFDHTITVPFENITAKAPAEYDVILRSIFGDYMQLPPVEQRVSGHEFLAYWK